MKFTLKIILYGAIGFAAGYLILELLYGRNTDATLEVIYYWLSIVMIVLAAALLIYAFIRRRKLIKLTNDKNRTMNEDDFDVYSYNAFNIITVTTAVPLVLSLIALAIQTMAAENPWLVGFTIILLFISGFMNLQASALINIIYPDKDLPKPGDKKYNQKLLAASDEGELFIMTKALYSSWTLTSMLLFFAMIMMIFYSFVTDESQIFSIVIIGLIMIISQLKYSYEIREK
ncbi:hypothetical protein BN1048_01450 [Jeotgalicoccus saudimassiliensis]|uniref:DUF3169 family protein n=1 Tax=Jeotgalicoccus saudimassiliensis TaxID=1461582 RepID=A0A078M612_9STAP|nr:DUF3169 family protein [Jeotgalicoccus saudimassiliensis]CEA01664.1 hypothetical protein BN1048_01450 [Jeotgalicoccus saudimassiliensis]